MSRRPVVKSKDVLRIAIDGNLHPRTVERVLSGEESVRANSVETVKDAARRLGISLPPELLT